MNMRQLVPGGTLQTCHWILHFILSDFTKHGICTQMLLYFNIVWFLKLYYNYMISLLPFPPFSSSHIIPLPPQNHWLLFLNCVCVCVFILLNILVQSLYYFYVHDFTAEHFVLNNQLRGLPLFPENFKGNHLPHLSFSLPCSSLPLPLPPISVCLSVCTNTHRCESSRLPLLGLILI